MKTLHTLFLLFLLAFLVSSSVAAGLDDRAPYKLALLHTKNEDPESVLLKRKIEPSGAVISEFEWILQSLRNRCLETEDSLAGTIVETWYVTKQRSARISLLEIARALSQMSQNTNLFGRGKVSFRAVSKYWLAKHFLPMMQR